MTDDNLSIKEGESELAYLWRLGELKYNGVIDMTWEELAEVLNRNLRDSEEDYLGSSAYRKKYAILKQAKDELFTNDLTGDINLCEEIVALRQELEKERVKLRDERTAYKKLIREQARKETLDDLLLDSVDTINKHYPLIGYSNLDIITDMSKEAVLCFSDWHYGMTTKNIWNEYNPEICRDRVRHVLDLAKHFIKVNHVGRLHLVLLGDFAHGLVNKCNLGSSKDVCDQIMEVAEILAICINELSNVVEEVIVHSCYGNHLRSAPNKQDVLPSDNMEKIIPWLKQRLSDNPKVRIMISAYKEYTLLNVCGYNVVCVHGNDFNFKDIGVVSSSLFNKLFGVNVSYTVSGDRHHFEEIEKFGVESILVSSLCGTDDYANSLRLYGKAGQTLMIFNKEYGRESTYHIPVE